MLLAPPFLPLQQLKRLFASLREKAPCSSTRRPQCLLLISSQEHREMARGTAGLVLSTKCSTSTLSACRFEKQRTTLLQSRFFFLAKTSDFFFLTVPGFKSFLRHRWRKNRKRRTIKFSDTSLFVITDPDRWGGSGEKKCRVLTISDKRAAAAVAAAAALSPRGISFFVGGSVAFVSTSLDTRLTA